MWSSSGSPPKSALNADKIEKVPATLLKDVDGLWETLGPVSITIVATRWAHSKQLSIEGPDGFKLTFLLSAALEYKAVEGGFTFLHKNVRYKVELIQVEDQPAVDLGLCRAIFSNWHKDSNHGKADDEILRFVHNFVSTPTDPASLPLSSQSSSIPSVASISAVTSPSPLTSPVLNPFPQPSFANTSPVATPPQIPNVIPTIPSTGNEPLPQPFPISPVHSGGSCDASQLPSLVSTPLPSNHFQSVASGPFNSVDDLQSSPSVTLDSPYLSNSNSVVLTNSPPSQYVSPTASPINAIITQPSRPPPRDIESLEAAFENLSITQPKSPLLVYKLLNFVKEVEGDVEITVTGDIYRFVPAEEAFLLIENDVKCVISNVYPDSQSNFERILYIIRNDEIVLSTVISPAIRPEFGEEHGGKASLIWIQGGGVTLSFLHQPTEKFCDLVFRALYESKNARAWVEDEAEEVVDLNSSSSSEEEEENEEESSEEQSEDEFRKVRGKNTLVLTGRRYEKSFVFRGNQIGVFNKHERGLKFTAKLTTTIPSSGKKKNATIQAKVGMLHEEDQSLLLLDTDLPHSIFKMDLERGEIVEEFNLKKLEANSILPEKKYDQKTKVKTFLGLNSDGIFTVDPRKSDVVVKSKSFQYKSPAYITCGASTEKGHIVVGTKKGEIKLYDAASLESRCSTINTSLRAKNNFPGLGDPIIGMDTTADGYWVVATCKKYLVVYRTKYGEETAYENILFKREKPKPRLLRLKPEDERKVGEVNFTPAKFNYDSETTICTSTGKWIVKWDFHKVRRNTLDVYTLTPFDDIVVANDFLTSSIVVAMPDAVKLTNVAGKKQK